MPTVNAGVLGAVGYYAYTEWDRPRWDKRIVSAVSVGLLTLWSGEGCVFPFAEHSRQLMACPVTWLSVIARLTTDNNVKNKRQ